MRILVTGGAGFLGSNLCEKLLNLNHEVIAVDNMLTGSAENIFNLQKFEKFIDSLSCNKIIGVDGDQDVDDDIIK